MFIGESLHTSYLMSPRSKNETNMLSKMMIPTIIMQKRMIYLVLTIHETNFSATNSNISSWDIGGWTNIATKLCHERLAKTSHFRFRFPLRIKVRTPLATAKRQPRQSVFEDLLKA
mmetsp:Transcript_33728/g.59221  ORF Transcript_33728/g.59221 Transcript_33728/m.59221 type:complete len:116 (+) Transcript_33728:887-1234(+)